MPPLPQAVICKAGQPPDHKKRHEWGCQPLYLGLVVSQSILQLTAVDAEAVGHSSRALQQR